MLNFLTVVTELSEQDADLLEQQISAIAGGDMAALAALYEQTKSAVYGFALSLTRNPHDAEDVLQTVYVQLHKNAGQYRRQGKPLAWILTIARNTVRMKQRRDNRLTALPADYEVEDTKNPLQTKEDQMVLLTALNALNSTERQIVILHAVSGMKHRELAELLQLPLSTVISKYNRAIKKLERALKEEAV
ncbi:MAG: RNA polymerase sigma factor [Clostridia bacterium]|nr:RNA polymerase sigma factor [Clostridia bacterium]